MDFFTSSSRCPALSLPSLAALLSLVPLVNSASAASQTWAAVSTDANWATAANWAAGAVPGVVNASSNDVATFNSAVSGGFGSSTTPLVIDINRSIGGIRFDTAGVGAFTIGTNAGNQLQLTALTSAANLTQVTTDVTAAQVIAAPIFLRNGSGSANPTYTFRNSATDPLATLTLSGAQTWNGSGTRPTFVILDGSNGGANTISGNIANPASGQGGAQITKNGTGTWILSGTNTFTGTASSGIVINGGILGAYNANALGAGANNNKVAINSGGTLQLGNAINLVDTQRLNLNDGGTIQSNGSTTTSATVAVNTAATSVTLSTVASADVFTIGNGANDFTGGTAGTSTTNIAGPGTVFLSQASNYAGGWSINSGTLRLGSTTALGLSSTAMTFGPGSSGKLMLNGNSTSIGSLATNATVGTPLVENGTAGTATLTVGGTTSTTYAGLLKDGAAGVLALTKSGTGTLSLSGANTYTGETAVTGGILRVNNLTGTSATGTNTVTVGTGGTLGGAGFISGAVTVNGTGILAPGNSVGTLTVGTLTLNSGSILNYEFNPSPANDYTNVTTPGGLTINGGGFNLYQENTLNAFSTINTYNVIGYSGAIGGTGVSALSVLNPQPGRAYTFGATGSVVTLGIASSGVISDWSADAGGSWGTPGSWTGAIPDTTGATANLNFPLTAPRIVTLDGTRTVGGISIDSGAAPLGYTVAAGSGGTLAINNGLSQANIIITTGANAITAGVSLDSTNTVAAVAAASSLTISGSIGGIGALVKSGPGLLDLTNTVNGYAGNISALGGTLGFAGLGSLGGGTSLTVDGATLRYNAGNTADISSKTVTIGVAGATIDTGGNNLTYANAIGNGGAGNLVINGGSSVTMQGNNTFTGTTTLNGGSLILAGTSGTSGGTFINGAGSLLAITADGALGAVPGAAAANLTLNPGAGNTTTVRADGIFSLNGNRNISLASGTVVFDSNGNNTAIAGSLTGNGLFRKTGTGTLTLSGTATANGGTTLDAGTVSIGTTANLPTGALTLNGTAAIIATSATSSNFSPLVNGNNSITGTAVVIQNLGTLTGGGNLTFGGPFVNDYVGSFTAFTGTLTGSGGGSRWNGSTGGTNLTLDLANTGTSVRSTATTITIGALAGSTTANLSGSGGGATQAVTYQIGGKTVGGLGVTPVDSIYDGIITNGAGLTSINKIGLSTLTLTNGGSTYTGTTTVTAGTLVINGTQTGATGAISVAGGATLGGSGSVGGAITFADNAVFAPGNSPGTFTTTSSTNFSGASILNYELNGTNQTVGGGVNDYFTGITSLTLDGVLNIADTVPGSFSLVSSGTWTLMSYSGALTDNILTLGTVPALAPGSNFQITAGGGQVLLNVVPEPGTVLLGFLASIGVLRRRRR